MIWFLLGLSLVACAAAAWFYYQLRGYSNALEQVEASRNAEASGYQKAKEGQERAVEELLATRDDLAYWKASAEHWQQEYEKANQDAIKAREIVADWVAQRTFGKSIFHVAPALPIDPKLRKPIPRARIQGRLAVKLAEQQFEKAEREYLERQKNGGRPATLPAESAVQIEIGSDS